MGVNITVTGATGFIGRHLVQSLAHDRHSVRALSRAAWNVLAGEPPAESLTGVDAVVHLAGSPVSQRWTPWAKKEIRASRVKGTHHLVTALSTLQQRPMVLVCASAIGIYGDRGDEVLTEGSPVATGFLADVCREWESEADLAESLGVRVVKLRFGIALGRKGGALEKMLPPFRAFMGGRLGPGSQWMSWIHIDDIVGLIRCALGSPLSGVVNAATGGSSSPAGNLSRSRSRAAGSIWRDGECVACQPASATKSGGSRGLHLRISRIGRGVTGPVRLT
jgi:uncharacterized protein (TIGR01777 family)